MEPETHCLSHDLVYLPFSKVLMSIDPTPVILFPSDFSLILSTCMIVMPLSLLQYAIELHTARQKASNTEFIYSCDFASPEVHQISQNSQERSTHVYSTAALRALNEKRRIMKTSACSPYSTPIPTSNVLGIAYLLELHVW